MSVLDDFFLQHNEFFKLEDGTVLEVNPLCGSRTFIYLARQGKIKKIARQHKSDVCIVRSEKHRLISAYNKKVLSRRSDYKKSILLLLMGISFSSSFENMLDVLIERKRNKKFIDKHFRKCTSCSDMNLTLKEFVEGCGDSVLSDLIKNTVVASSKSLAGDRSLDFSDLSDDALNKLEYYINE